MWRASNGEAVLQLPRVSTERLIVLGFLKWCRSRSRVGWEEQWEKRHSPPRFVDLSPTLSSSTSPTSRRSSSFFKTPSHNLTSCAFQFYPLTSCSCPLQSTLLQAWPTATLPHSTHFKGPPQFSLQRRDHRHILFILRQVPKLCGLFQLWCCINDHIYIGAKA